MTMLQDIEDAIINRLTLAGLNVFHWDEKPKLDEPDMAQAVARILIRGGSFDRSSMTRIKCTCEIVVVVDVLAPAGAVLRDRATYDLLMGVVGQLWNKKLGLEITPVKPTLFSRDFDGRKLDGSISTFAAVFETSFTVSEMADEADDDWNTLDLQYFLQDPTDDGLVDGEDILDIPQ